MNRFGSVFPLFKTFVSFLVIVCILSGNFISINDIDENINSDINCIYEATSMSDYYNFVANIPVKLVGKLLTLNISDDIAASKHQEKKQEKKSNGSNDVAFTSGGLSGCVFFENANNCEKDITVSNSRYKNRILADYFYYCSVLLVFTLMLMSLISLARGDTEDNIILNKYKFKIRLV